MLARLLGFTLGNRGGLAPKIDMECMFTAQGPSVLHAIEVAVVQFAQVRLVYVILLYPDDDDDDRQPCVAMTPWVYTPLQLISDFFHVNQGV